MASTQITVKIPASREYGNVNLLVETIEREETTWVYDYPIVDANTYDPYKELSRVISGGKYKLELIRGYLTTDKPMIVIKEI